VPHFDPLDSPLGRIVYAPTAAGTMKSEWDNRCGDLWGRERLETLLRACRDCTPAQIVRRIVDEVTAFAKDRSQRDDMTVMVVGVDDSGV